MTISSTTTAPSATGVSQARVLIVNDDAVMSATLRNALPDLGDWNLTFTGNGTQALAHLAEHDVDVVVTDMRLRETNGAGLLATIREQWPQTARIVLFGSDDRDAAIAVNHLAQQFLPKPCSAADLGAAIQRAVEVRNTLADPVLRELMGEVKALPSVPSIYHRLTMAMESPDWSIEVIGGIISADVAVTAGVLRTVNSSLFGLPRRVSSVETAVLMLGMENIMSLVLTTAVFEDDPKVARVLDIEMLRENAMMRAGFARTLAKLERLPLAELNVAVMAGMMREVGALVLAVQLPDRMSALQHALLRASVDEETPGPDPIATAELEQEILGCSITAASAYLLGLWSFPPAVVHAVVSQPLSEPGPNTSRLEYILDFVHRRALDPVSPVTLEPSDYLNDERLAAWNAAVEPLTGPAPAID